MDDAPEYQLQPRIGNAIAHISHQQDGQPGVPLQRLIRLTVRRENSLSQLDTPPALSSRRGVFVLSPCTSSKLARRNDRTQR